MSESKEVIMEDDETGNSLASIGSAVSSMPKESLKSLLYLVAGKQDSNVKLFWRLIDVKPEDISELNSLIQEKLMQHHTEAAVASADVMYKNGRATQFGTWMEFEDHNWNTSYVIEKITIKWDFVVSLPHFAMPQRHTLTVTLLGSFNPLHMLQAVFSKDPGQLSEVEMETAPVICRVDFISHLLSDELIFIVENWVNSRRIPSFISPPKTWLKKNKLHVARLVHYSIPLLFGVLAASIFHSMTNGYDPSIGVSMQMYEQSMYWLLGVGIGISATSVLGKKIGRSIYKSIDDYGAHTMFQFTNGDKNKRTENANQNRKEIRKFWTNLITSLVLNIIAAIFSYILFKG